MEILNFERRRVLEKQMQEHVDPPAGDESFTGEAHYFLDLRPITRGIAMNGAMLAHWLGVEGAIGSLHKRVEQEFPAFATKNDFLAGNRGDVVLRHGDRLLLSFGMIAVAVDRNEGCQGLQVLCDDMIHNGWHGG